MGEPANSPISNRMWGVFTVALIKTRSIAQTLFTVGNRNFYIIHLAQM